MIRFVPEVGSTSGELAARLADGEHVPEGEWLVAARQTAGRGRAGSEWHDGLGNFMGSTLVHARMGDPPARTLALVAGLAVHGVVSSSLPSHPNRSALSLSKGRPGSSSLTPSTGEQGVASAGAGQAGISRELGLQLKWPNDLLVGAAKLAGILLEQRGNATIVGIGVNIAVAPRVTGRATISLAQLAPPPSRDAFAEALAQVFDLEVQRWREFGLGPILRRWTAAAHPEGTRLAVASAGDRVEGTFAGLDESGALRLRLASGAVRAIHAGEVLLRDREPG